MIKTKKYFLGICGCLVFNVLSAQVHLQPTPQQYVEENDSIELSVGYSLYADSKLAYINVRNLLHPFLKEVTNQKSMPIYIGVKGDKQVRNYVNEIPACPEGYFLKIDKKNIVLAANDERGLFYGAQTLRQVLEQKKVPLLQIKDYPDLPYRGVVEGFYGKPWTHEARLSQIEFYGKNKMNVYLYGPKNDPYHSTPNWRKPYPEKEAAQIKELVKKAKENEVLFYWAIHPGQDIKWTAEDRNMLINKFEKMYDLGIRAFAVFFDDISGVGTDANKQAELLNYLDDHFVKVKGDVAPLVMCPTEYNKSWANVKGGYLTTLGEKLNKGIEIMWTGNRVVACIDKPTLDFINPLIHRKAYIWWNFPVSDYVRDHLLMGDISGNAQNIKDAMGGFVANPMEHPEASKISLYSVADYTWNMGSFDSKQSWKNAIRTLMPTHAEYLEIFVRHNADLGKNGHNFRREESVNLLPFLATLTKDYQPGKSLNQAAYEKVLEECNLIIQASDILQASKENRELIDDIRPWLIQFKLLGEYGREVLSLVKIDLQNKEGKEEYLKTYEHIRALAALMSEVDAVYNQNPFQPGVKTGGRYLLPTFNELFEKSVSFYNACSGSHLEAKAGYIPYTLESNVPQLKSLPVRQKGKGGEVSPSNEVIAWQPDGELVVWMDYKRVLESLYIDLGDSNACGSFAVSITEDGGEWQDFPLKATGRKTLLSVDVSGKKIQGLRLKNVSSAMQKVFFKQLRFVEK